MDNLEKTRELLRKFKQGNLLPSENRELASILSAGDDREDLRKVMEDHWDSSASQGKVTAVRERSSPGRFITPFMKYAALILITIGITWFGKDVLYRMTVQDKRDGVAMASNEVFVPYGSKTRVVFPDGSVVTLNSGSYLRYPSKFDSINRSAYIQGEAFFDIKKDRRHPFLVKTSDITIKVLGTRFNVKSYSDERTVETTLVSGSIEIYRNENPLLHNERILVLKPNQQAIYEKETGGIAVSENTAGAGDKSLKPIKSFLVQKKVDIDPVIAWKDDRMIFRDENFADLSKKLERWYNVEIVIQDEDLSDASFSGIFEKETIEQALNALRIATPFEYKMNKNKIMIYK